MYIHTTNEENYDHILLSIMRYSINIDDFDINNFDANRILLLLGDITFDTLEKFINLGFKKIVLVTGNMCDACLSQFGYKRNWDFNKKTTFNYKLFSKEIFNKVHERLPIENLVSKTHFEDEWIFTGLPSASMLFDKQSPIKIIGQFTNISNNQNDNFSQNELSLYLESNSTKPISIPISKLVKINNCFVQHWNISTAGFESAISVLFETFVSTKTHACDKSAIPILLESFLPPDYAVISPRLDCDEAVKSSELLKNLYIDNSFKLNLAITTKQNIDNKDKELISEIERNNGSISNHSHEHAIYWGLNDNTFNKDFDEAKKIISNFSDSQSKTCVAPFHQSNIDLITQLTKKNVELLITGNSKYSPEHMIAIGGEISKQNKIMVHSQQCMLHGDSWPELKDIYFKAFMLSARRQSIFGYLDHPISERYDYDWGSKINQLNAHKDLIEFFKKNFKVRSISHQELLSWLKIRSQISIHFSGTNQIKTFVDLSKIKKSRNKISDFDKFKFCQILFDNNIVNSRIKVLT